MIKKYINYFENLSLRRKLLVFFLLVSMIPTFIMGFSSFNISSKLVKERKIDETIFKLKNIDEKVTKLLKEKELIAIRFSMDSNVMKVLQSYEDENIKEIFNLDKMLFDYKFSEDTHSIYVFNNEGHFYTSDINPPAKLEEIIHKYTENQNIKKTGTIIGVILEHWETLILYLLPE